MYRKNKIDKKNYLRVNNSYEGETIEVKVQRLVKNKEPLDGGNVSLTYTERQEGVKPEHNIRTDRFEIAATAMDKVARSKIAKRDNMGKAPIIGIDENIKPTGTEGNEGKA